MQARHAFPVSATRNAKVCSRFFFLQKEGDKNYKVSLCLTLCPLRWRINAFFSQNMNHMVCSYPFLQHWGFRLTYVYLFSHSRFWKILNGNPGASTTRDLAPHSRFESSSLILFQNALSCVFLDRFTTYWYLFSAAILVIRNSYWLGCVYMHSVGWQFDPRVATASLLGGLHVSGLREQSRSPSISPSY